MDHIDAKHLLADVVDGHIVISEKTDKDADADNTQDQAQAQETDANDAENKEN